MTDQLIQYGRHRQRRSYARINEVLELLNLIEIQTTSYEWFMEEGLREMFQDISPIEDFTGKLSLEFVDYSLGEPKYPVGESKERDVTYNAPLRVKVRLINNETDEVKEQEVFMGDFPLMTDTGTFIINGAERVIVSQLVRSPSVYYNEKIDKNGKRGVMATEIQIVVHGWNLKQMRKMLLMSGSTVHASFRLLCFCVRLVLAQIRKLLI